ncbi:MAG: PAS domain S-box protein [Gemmatimonadales bacterium]|nr:MAG: PAS domain S-box protein [Gemmatimonadales bacterium]
MSEEESPTNLIRLRAAVESAPSGLLMVESTGRIVLVNREIERLFGYPREELLGQSVDLLVPDALRGGHHGFRGEFFENPQIRAMGAGRDLHGQRKDGARVPVEIGLTPVATEEGLFVLASVVDITARQRAQARFEAAVESSPAGMVMVDEAGSIVLVNREVERMFGWDREELLGRKLEILVPERFRSHHPGFRSGFFKSPDTRPMGAGRDLYGLHRDGTEIPVEIGLNPIESEEGAFVLSSIVDISERKREEAEREELERQLRHAQKMDAVGTLAGGIAHDFNNILGAILGFAELLEDAVDGDQARQDLEELVAFTLRGKSLIQKVQAFGRRQERERRPMALDGLVGEVGSFLRSSLPPSIDIRTSVAPRTPRVLADPAAMHQVLMNLGMNAAQSMSEGGTINMELTPLYVSDSRARAHPSLNEGPHARVSVRDTGSGIEPEIQNRIFEPFFTTKPPGQGTGLGLAIVHRIVREHGGAIELESALGEGTSVRILLPAVLTDEGEHPDAGVDVPRGGGRRILLVDDEPGLLKIGKRQLEKLGYTVVVGRDGDEALGIFRSDTRGFDAVVSDYLMPTMNGLELAEALTRIDPELPIVMLTGFIDNLEGDTIRAAGVGLVIRKPATIAELGAALATVLKGA